MTATTTSAPAPLSIWDAARAADARRPRSVQTQLGASDTICARRRSETSSTSTPPPDRNG
ncbi:hypothetical protein DEJ48_36550 [Streptomyces venezuelae]|uniref:Uncharacterized protein n=1 Tax=Streptomyces venezuelae TaxID=54571 RepID=A0A5P2C7H3_STRVZ|nr:hypothetical protein DEJ48_36550 [Streptomyces venezuelae]